jgi:hypothetical protein
MKYEITLLQTNGTMSIHHLDHSPQKEEVEEILMPLVKPPLPGRYICSDWHFRISSGTNAPGAPLRWNGKLAYVWSLQPTPMANDTREENDLAQDIANTNSNKVLGPVLIVTLA